MKLLKLNGKDLKEDDFLAISSCLNKVEKVNIGSHLVYSCLTKRGITMLSEIISKHEEPVGK